MEQHELDDMLANQRLLIESLQLRVAMLEKVVFLSLDEMSPAQQHVVGEDTDKITHLYPDTPRELTIDELPRLNP